MKPPSICYPLRHLAGLAALAVFAATVHAQEADDGACGNPFVSRYGPFDYRFDRGPKLKVVEDAHFGPKVEGLLGGMTGTIEGDLAYTLRAFPNHHRALISIMNLAQRSKNAVRKRDEMPWDCYFVRAVRFRPDDPLVRLIYAQYLTRSNRKAEAMAQLDAATRGAKDNPFTHYNIGLVFFELGEHDKARAQAHKAIELGFDRPDLKQRLQDVGKWAEPSTEGADAAASGTAPAAAGSAPAQSPSAGG